VSSRFFSADNTSASVASLSQAMRNLSVVMPAPSQASTSCSRRQGVDARDKPAHDGVQSVPMLRKDYL
jgi:hypothetical protein